MKKWMALLLALALALSLAACGGGGKEDPSGGNETQEPPSGGNAEDNDGGNDEQADEHTNTEYAVGDTFGTDSVECVVTAADWVTKEDIETSPLFGKVMGSMGTGITDGKTGDVRFSEGAVVLNQLYPGYNFLGKTYLEPNDKCPYFVVTLTLRNIGKKEVTYGTSTDSGIPTLVPYGNVVVLYDDGFTFESSGQGFVETLEVLGEAIGEGRAFELPTQVSENADKPLKLSITLPNANGETEEFIVTVR